MSNVATPVSHRQLETALDRLKLPNINIQPDLKELTWVIASLIARYASEDANVNEVCQHYYLTISKNGFDNDYFDKVVAFTLDVLTMEAADSGRQVDKPTVERLCGRIVALTCARNSTTDDRTLHYLTVNERDIVYDNRIALNDLEDRLNDYEKQGTRDRGGRDYRNDRDGGRGRPEPLKNRNMGSIYSQVEAVRPATPRAREVIDNSDPWGTRRPNATPAPALSPAPTPTKPQPEDITMIQAMRDTGNLPKWAEVLYPVVFDASHQTAFYCRGTVLGTVSIYELEDTPVDYKAHETEYLLRNRNVHYKTPDFDAIRKEKQYKADIEALKDKLNANLFEGAIADDVTFDIIRTWAPVERLPGDPHVTAIAELDNQDAEFDFNTTCLAMNVVTYNPECYTEPDAVQAIIKLSDATDFLDLRERVLEFKQFQEPHGFGTLNRDLTNHVNELLKVYEYGNFIIDSFVDDIQELLKQLDKDSPKTLKYLNETGLKAITSTTLMVDGDGTEEKPYARFALLESWLFLPLPSSSINLSASGDVAYVVKAVTPELYKLLDDLRVLSSPAIRRSCIITLDGDVIYCLHAPTENNYVLSTSPQF